MARFYKVRGVIQLRKAIWKCGACLLFLFLFSSLAEAQDVIKIVVTGDNVNIRSAPSSKGKVYAQASNGEEFLVDPVLIQDNSDKSTWYKILFYVSEMDGSIFQAHKLPTYDFSYPYISTRFVKKEPLDEDNKNALDYFNRGRPLNIHVGDDLSSYSLDTESYVLQVPITLRKEPKANADTIVLPVGTVVLVCPNELGIYYDMDEECWFYLMDENQKLIGWAPSDLQL